MVDGQLTLQTVFKFVFTIVLLAVIYLRVDLNGAAALLLMVNWWFLAGCIILYAGAALVRAWRFGLICQGAFRKVRLKGILGPYLIATGYGSFFSLGEDIYKITGVNPDWNGIDRMTTVVLDRLTGLIGLLFAAWLGFLFSIWEDVPLGITLRVCLFIVTVAILIIFLWAGFLIKFWESLRCVNFFSKMLDLLSRIAIDSKVFFSQHLPLGVSVVAIAAGVQLIINAPIFVLAWSAVGGEDFLIPAFFFIVPIVSALNALPVSIFGIGVREVSLLYLMEGLGASQEKLLAASLLVLIARAANSLLIVILGGMAERRWR